MKKLLAIAVLLSIAAPALACDESCERENASATYNADFPSYLSWKFCEDTKLAFVDSDVSSLENYRNTRLDTQYKGSMNNIKKFVEQRKAWLTECDDYMKKTNHGRIFKDQATTEQVFAAMDEIAKELNRAIKGVTYIAVGGQDDNAIIATKFDHLFKLVDDHRAVMMLQGQFVTN